MKFVLYALAAFVLLTLVVVVFDVEVQPVYNSELFAIGLSAVSFAFYATAAALIILAGPAMLGAFFGEALLDAGEAVGCLVILVLLPLVIAAQTAGLVFGHRVLEFFPSLTWGQSAIVLVGLWLSSTSMNITNK